MLYFIPVAAYVIYFFLDARGPLRTTLDHIVLVLAAIFMFILAITGRDFIGSYLVDVLDYYHFMGISNLLFVGALWYCRPRSQKVRT
jgi:hypothetical protein